MNENSKGENGNNRIRAENLLKMEEAVKRAGYYIVRFDLETWKHRLYRFLGRVCDYKGDFKRAISYYRKSLRYARMDPEYLELKYPRWLEVEAFLSYSLIMSGQTGKGHTFAENVYRKFDSDKEAIFLKQNDYVTWAIWKSGVSIRTVNALLDKGITFNKKEAFKWLDDTERILNPAKNKKLWANFQYRKDEINAVRKRIKASIN